MNQDIGVFTGIVLTFVAITMLWGAWEIGQEHIRSDCRKFGEFRVGNDRFTCKEMGK